MGIFHFPNALLVVVIVLVSAWGFLGLSFAHANWLVLVVSILVIALSSTAAALLVGNFGIVIYSGIRFRTPELDFHRINIIVELLGQSRNIIIQNDSLVQV